MGEKHTPGPWEIKPLRGKYYGTIIHLPNGDEINVWTPGKNYEASAREIAEGWTVECGMDHVETAECYANARLISAAPELLDALKTWMLFFNAMPKGQLGKISCDIGLLNDAFIKTGRALELLKD